MTKITSCADCQHRVPGTDGGDEQASEGEGLGDEIGGGETVTRAKRLVS